MPDAWEVLVSNSVAPPGSDAWTHLLNQQGGGGGGDTYLSGCIDVDVGAPAEDLSFSVVDDYLDISVAGESLDIEMEDEQVGTSEDGFDIDHGTC